MIDTDILSEVLKGKNETVSHHFLSVCEKGDEIFISSVTVYEVLYGLHSKQAFAQLGQFARFLLGQTEVTPTRQDYRMAAKIRADLRVTGRPIGSADPLIAASAVALDATLVTGNIRHYNAIRDVGFNLSLSDWRSPTP